MAIQQNSITFCELSSMSYSGRNIKSALLNHLCLSESVPWSQVYHMSFLHGYHPSFGPWSSDYFLCVEVYPMDYYSNKGGPWANYGTHSGHGGAGEVKSSLGGEKEDGKDM